MPDGGQQVGGAGVGEELAYRAVEALGLPVGVLGQGPVQSQFHETFGCLGGAPGLRGDRRPTRRLVRCSGYRVRWCAGGGGGRISGSGRRYGGRA